MAYALASVATANPIAGENVSLERIELTYAAAKELYSELGVDVDAAIDRLANFPISLHCWQGDDVRGFTSSGDELGGGLAVTGNYPGQA